MAAYVAAHFEQLEDAWDPQDNPTGYIGLCIAENKLLAGEFLAALESTLPAPAETLAYDAVVGNLEFRRALADFMGRHLVQGPVDAEQLIVLGGAGSVLEQLFYVIADPRETVLVPTPSYAGFWADLETRDELHLQTVDARSETGFALDLEALEAARLAAPTPVRALLLTSPDNPLGRVHPRETLEQVAAWADAHEIHLVFDEVYALSVFGPRAFTSGAQLSGGLGPRHHVVWGFSKDFGASGLRCGVLLSHNAQVRRAVGELAYWSGCSGHTQYMLARFLSDAARADAYVTRMRESLGGAHATVSAALHDEGIDFRPGEAGFFVVCDLRAHLSEASWEGERRLWARLLAEARVNLTPGEACRIAEPGFFRLCYASMPAAAVREGVARLGRALGSKPSGG